MALRSLVGTIGLTLALIIGLAFPVIYGTYHYLDRGKILSFKAQLNAQRLAKYIYANNVLWQYQRDRIAEIILLPSDDEGPVRQRVVDLTDAVVTQDGVTQPWPVMRRDAPILVRGDLVGRMQVEASLVPVLQATGWAALFSFALGYAAYFAVRVFPLRVLDRTLGELAAQNLRFDTALSNMSQGLSMFDADQRLVVCNERYKALYGIAANLTKPGTYLRDILATHGTYEGQQDEIPQEYKRALLTLPLDNKTATTIVELKDGRAIAVHSDPMPGGGWIATHEDITEQRNASARLTYMAHHDALTDLPNRVLLRHRLNEALDHLQPSECLAVLCLDLDHFKEINDTLGHPVGDALLKQVADRLRACIGDSDVVARMGGDEFTIVQSGAAQPTNATALASRVIEMLGTPYEIDGHHVTTGASIGVVVAPSDGTHSDHLLKSADLALYQAKAEGRGAYRFFEAGMNERMQARRKLEIDLRSAITKGEFELHYQPLFDLEKNEVVGYEALLRWNHPERGKVSPLDFIPLAEETGLIVPIGEWVLRQACADAAKWPEHIRIAVNLSPVQFKSHGLVQTVFNALAAAGLAASRLELEITESVLLANTEASLAMLHQLRGLGASISMDDFGTGYSSLSYLQSFPFDKIKLDRSFIKDLGENKSSLAILRAVASLGASLGVSTTAEGVETEEQMREVRAEGITQIQGYLISRPQPAQDVTRSFHRSSAVQPASPA